MNRKPSILAVFLILVLALLTGCGGGKKDYSDIIENPNISIPGYDSLDFKAGKKKQSVNFYNPEVNTCYFCISLRLKQREEEILWTSEWIEPGEEIRDIQLSRELKSGEYPAILKYECFSLKDETPLNGSNVELALSVK